jgi:hypothetical protein
MKKRKIDDTTQGVKQAASVLEPIDEMTSPFHRQTRNTLSWEAQPPSGGDRGSALLYEWIRTESPYSQHPTGAIRITTR